MLTIFTPQLIIVLFVIAVLLFLFAPDIAMTILVIAVIIFVFLLAVWGLSNFNCYLGFDGIIFPC